MRKSTVCAKTFNTQVSLSKHTEEAHAYECPMCQLAFPDSTKLNDHVKDNHTFECEMCSFEGTTATIMENHILEKHFNPDENNKFSCDECSYTCDNREQLRKHFEEKHPEDPSHNIEDELVNNRSPEEESNLKEELRLVKNNFQRLEVLFQDSLEEVGKVRGEYEAKLIEANDRFRAVKAENEELKEKVDILFKLGRSYINRKETNGTEEKEEEGKSDTNRKSPGTDADDIETITIEEVTEEDLKTWTKNKMRGFRRTGPSAPAAKKTNQEAKGPKKTPDSESGTVPPPNPANSHTSKSTSEQEAKENQPQSGRPMYCHYFSNYGKCNFEERTGGKCRYEHKDAPICQSGMSCSRSKCMYKHPNMAGRRTSFLDQTPGFPQHMNPWQKMNPWWMANQNQPQFPSPWNTNMERH